MSEIDPLNGLEEQFIATEAGVMLEHSLKLVQQAPDGKEAFDRSFPFVQHEYDQGIVIMAAMQRKLGVNVTQVEHPNDVAGLSNYSRHAVVENALHSIAASNLLQYREKTDLVDIWTQLTTGRRATFDSKTQARIFAIDSLDKYGFDHEVKDARDLAAELSQRPFVRGSREFHNRLGRISIFTSK